MAWKVRDGGVWKDVTDPKIEVGGQWVPVVRGLVREAGVWKRFYPDSEITTTAITSGLTGTVPVGVARTVSGTVTALSGTISGGTVTLYQRPVGGAWVVVGTGTPGTGAVAAWGVSATPSICGASEFKAVYSGTATNEPSESALSAVTTVVNTPVKPTGGTITNTTAALSWTATAGAASYEVYRNGVLVGSPASAAFTDTGLTPGTAYSWTVKAKYGTCLSAASPAKTGTTGTDAVQDTGSATIEVRPDATNSYRPDVGWGYVGETVAEGYYTDSGRNYTGCIDYGTNAQLRAKVEAALGANGATRYDNMTVSAARVYLQKKTGVGSSASVTVSFFNSTSQSGVGGAPPRSGTKVDAASAASGAGSWLSIGTAHWAALKAGTARSIVLYNLTTAAYSQFDGKSLAANRCNLQLDCSWNYALTAATPPAWTN